MRNQGIDEKKIKISKVALKVHLSFKYYMLNFNFLMCDLSDEKISFVMKYVMNFEDYDL